MRPIISAFAITSYSFVFLSAREIASGCSSSLLANARRNSEAWNSVELFLWGWLCALSPRLTAAVRRPRRGALDISSQTHPPCVAAHQQLRRSNYAKKIGWFVLSKSRHPRRRL
jgi:hypothetical protein